MPGRTTVELDPGELYWEDREGYPFYIIGLAAGGSTWTWEKDHAEAIAAVERKKAEDHE